MDITCPNCKYSRSIPDDKVPANSVKATCPQCGAKFRFRGPDFTLEAPEEPEAQASQVPEAPQAAPGAAQAPGPDPAPQPRTEADPAPGNGPEPGADPRPVRNIGLLRDDPAPGDQDAPASQGRRDGDIWDRLEDLGDSHPGREERDPDGPQPQGHPVVDVPFERLDRFGFFGGLWETCKRTATAPRLFFETMPVDRGYGRPAVFYVLLNIVAVMLQLAVEFAMHGVQAPAGADLPAEVQGLTAGAAVGASYLFVLAAGPLLLSFFLFGISAVLHLLLTLMQGVSGGFQATVRAVAYTALPSLCMAVPVAGMYVGSAWSIVMLVYALRGVHKTSFAKAALAVGLYTLGALALVVAALQGMPQGAGL
jgi:predicted Zn finger-like uncharacterized protein